MIRAHCQGLFKSWTLLTTLSTDAAWNLRKLSIFYVWIFVMSQVKHFCFLRFCLPGCVIAAEPKVQDLGWHCKDQIFTVCHELTMQPDNGLQLWTVLIQMACQVTVSSSITELNQNHFPTNIPHAHETSENRRNLYMLQWCLSQK